MIIVWVLLAAMFVLAAVVIAFGVSVFMGQRHSIAAISKSERKFRLLFENSIVGMLRFDPATGRVLESNQALLRILGTVTPDDIPGLLGLLHNGAPSALTTRLLSDRRIEGHELEVRDRSRTPAWLSLFGVVNDSDGTCEIVVADITHQKQAAEALRQVSRRIVEAEENERKRVARELHDGVNQTLSMAKRRLGSRGARGLIESAMDDVRRISRNLRPSVLDDLGFFPAVRTLTDDLRGRKRMDVRLEMFEGPLGVSPQVELAMYRVVQESLTNVERHSRATVVQVRVMRSEAGVVITVKDNGVGLRTKRRRPRNYQGGMGLGGLKERVELLGGRFAARSGKGRGTVVTAEFPVEEEIT